MDQSHTDVNHRAEQFLKLFLTCQRRFHGLIFSLVPNHADADDLLQETSAVLWRKFDEFEPGTDFASWGLRCARLLALKHHERLRSQRRVAFDDDLLELLCDEMTVMAREVDPRIEALRQCVSRLPDRAKTLVQLKYAEDSPVKSVAARVGLSADAVFKSLSRIRLKLMECVNRTLAMKGAS